MPRIEIREFWSRIGYHSLGKRSLLWYEESSVEQALKLGKEGCYFINRNKIVVATLLTDGLTVKTLWFYIMAQIDMRQIASLE